MHEVSLCEGILRVIEEEADRQSFQRVRQVTLDIGEMAGVELDAMRFSFEVVMRGSIADGAQLNISTVPGVAKCEQCLQTVTIKQRFETCPLCDSYPLTLLSGDELRIRDLEVE